MGIKEFWDQAKKKMQEVDDVLYTKHDEITILRKLKEENPKKAALYQKGIRYYKEISINPSNTHALDLSDLTKSELDEICEDIQSYKHKQNGTQTPLEEYKDTNTIDWRNFPKWSIEELKELMNYTHKSGTYKDNKKFHAAFEYYQEIHNDKMLEKYLITGDINWNLIKDRKQLSVLKKIVAEIEGIDYNYQRVSFAEENTRTIKDIISKHNTLKWYFMYDELSWTEIEKLEVEDLKTLLSMVEHISGDYNKSERIRTLIARTEGRDNKEYTPAPSERQEITHARYNQGSSQSPLEEYKNTHYINWKNFHKWNSEEFNELYEEVCSCNGTQRDCTKLECAREYFQEIRNDKMLEEYLISEDIKWELVKDRKQLKILSEMKSDLDRGYDLLNQNKISFAEKNISLIKEIIHKDNALNKFFVHSRLDWKEIEKLEVEDLETLLTMVDQISVDFLYDEMERIRNLINKAKKNDRIENLAENHWGEKGEANVDYELKWLLNDNIRVIEKDCQNAYGKKCILVQMESVSDEPQEIDHIVVTKSKVFSIESKYYKGKLSIQTNGNWIRETEDGIKKGENSPVPQSDRHHKILSAILDGIVEENDIVDVICISHSSAIIEGEENCPVSIIKVDGLGRFIKAQLESEPEKYDINEIIQKIEAAKVHQTQKTSLKNDETKN